MGLRVQDKKPPQKYTQQLSLTQYASSMLRCEHLGGVVELQGELLPYLAQTLQQKWDL